MISEVDELFVLWGIVFAVFTIKANQEPNSLSLIEVAQGETTLSASSDTWRLLADDEDAALPNQIALLDGGRANRAEAARRAYTYVAALTDPEAPSPVSARQPFQVSLHDDRGGMREFTLMATPFTPQRLATTPLGHAMAELIQEVGPTEIANALGSSRRVRAPEKFGPFHLDRAVAGGSGLVLDGWVANLAHREVHIVPGDLSALVSHASLALRSRQDVHEHLQSTGAAKSASSAHGFVAVLPAETASGDLEFFFLETDPSGDQATFFGPVRTGVRRDDNEALHVVRQAYGDLLALPTPVIDAVYRPLLAVPKNEALAKTFRFGPPAPEGEALTSIYHLQRVLGPGFELVLVVDDPRIWPEVFAALSNRSTSIKVPTVLLQNAENYGFGRANNLGFMAASGDVVFLMNSDILVMDSGPLEEAAEAIRARREVDEPELVVGFSLLYEDNTIQHIGMEFPKSSAVANLHLADHPMKGLPFSLYRGDSIRSAPAVTAALMGLSSDLYRTLGGFDPVYERGDFEDADLCLRAEQLGAEVQVYVRPGLYHLERQSIPKMGDGDLRQMVTYMNCAEFNRRWQVRLAPQPADAASKPIRRIQVVKRASVGA
jgi:hypothetical protein